jgi:hypothetical protein
VTYLKDYLKAVSLLTVSEAEEVRRESQLSRQELEVRLAQLEGLVSQLIAEKGEQVLAKVTATQRALLADFCRLDQWPSSSRVAA